MFMESSPVLGIRALLLNYAIRKRLQYGFFLTWERKLERLWNNPGAKKVISPIALNEGYPLSTTSIRQRPVLGRYFISVAAASCGLTKCMMFIFPQKKRQQVSYFRPQSNYYDIGDKDDNPNAAFSNEASPGKGDSLVTFNKPGTPLTAAGAHSNSLQANESQDTDSNFSTTGSRKGGKLGEAPNGKQTVDRNNAGDTSFVEINLT